MFLICVQHQLVWTPEQLSMGSESFSNCVIPVQRQLMWTSEQLGMDAYEGSTPETIDSSDLPSASMHASSMHAALAYGGKPTPFALDGAAAGTHLEIPQGSGSGSGVGGMGVTGRDGSDEADDEWAMRGGSDEASDDELSRADSEELEARGYDAVHACCK